MFVRLFRLSVFILLVSSAMTSLAHEIRPASLSIIWQPVADAADSGHWEIRWRQPILGEYGIAISPQLSSGWLEREPDKRIITGTSLIHLWYVEEPTDGLAGQTLRIEGLDRTITDVLVQVSFADGSQWSELVKAADATAVLPAASSGAGGLIQYLRLGFIHIWSGADHLLYVFALILLIHSRRALVMTITAFTLAHSLTLACSVLGLVSLKPAPVEAVIALSIVFVATEIVRIRKGSVDTATRMPWLIAFVFGLLHGFGFAGSLQEIGLPESAIALSLLLFNIGIELGQLLFVGVVLTVLWLLHSLQSLYREYIYRGMPYVIGTVASFWFIQRLGLIIT